MYLEVGAKRTFAGALDWPGWCRSGRGEEAALQTLVDYGPRYARVLQAAGIPFQPPANVEALAVVERLAGNATTDFGAPDVPLPGDALPLDGPELERLQAVLGAAWDAMEAAAQAAAGRELRTGPRGGGRDLERVLRHVLDSQQAYLRRLAWKPEGLAGEDLRTELGRTRQACLDALGAAARGALPRQGPRGGAIWPPRVFVRRSAWHLLDHAWEIEDRVV
ncbi:MAG TPA: DinB family protein [Roseiflexaceae bacterium]|nr:DinB family protein [Roseiflexaceae bacterium]